MGMYSDLTNEEGTFLLRLAEAYKTRGVTSWVHAAAGSGGFLLSSDGEGQQQLNDAPISKSFYSGLETKGFISLAYTSRGSLQFTMQRATLNYGEYTAANRLVQRWQDFCYELVQEKTVWAKLIWILLGYVLGFASAVLLRLFGWIKIGD